MIEKLPLSKKASFMNLRDQDMFKSQQMPQISENRNEQNESTIISKYQNYDDQLSKMEDSIASVVIETLKNDQIQEGNSIINFDNL